LLQLGDWHHRPAKQLAEEFLSPDGDAQEPMPDSATINGFGRCKIDCLDVRPRYTTTVQKGKRYLLRFINTSGMLPFTVSIDGHAMTILYVDGVPHRPLTVSSFDFYPAQRYSVVITADQPIANYWIRAIAGRVGVPGHVRNNPNFDDDVRGVLHYEGAPQGQDPNATSVPNNEFGNLDIRDLSVLQLTDPRLQGDTPADVVFELKFGRESPTDNRGVEWRVNDVAVRRQQRETWEEGKGKGEKSVHTDVALVALWCAVLRCACACALAAYLSPPSSSPPWSPPCILSSAAPLSAVISPAPRMHK